MGVIGDYAATGAAQKSDTDAAAPLTGGASPSQCPTCGQPVPATTIAKDAGFPTTASPPATGLGAISGKVFPSPAPTSKRTSSGVRG